MKIVKLVFVVILFLLAGVLYWSGSKSPDLSTVRVDPERNNYQAALPEQHRFIEAQTKQLLDRWANNGATTIAGLLPEKNDDEKRGIAAYLEQIRAGEMPALGEVWINASNKESPYWVAECRFKNGKNINFYYAVAHGRLQLVNIY